MEIKQKIEIIERNPQITKDVSLLKIILMPLELYVLKYLLLNEMPTNIREVYSDAILICFGQLFFKDIIEDPKTNYRFLTPQIISAGYGFGLIDPKEQKKVMEKYVKETKGMSETKIRNLWLEQIKKHHSKTPSYDKIRYIFENFERLGIIYKRGKEGKGIVYALNPNFYNQIKDKRKEIISL
jgi:hypothetical protein